MYTLRDTVYDPLINPLSNSLVNSLMYTLGDTFRDTLLCPLCHIQIFFYVYVSSCLTDRSKMPHPRELLAET